MSNDKRMGATNALKKVTINQQGCLVKINQYDWPTNFNSI